MKGRFKSGREFRRRTSNFSFASNPVTISVGEKNPLTIAVCEELYVKQVGFQGAKEKKTGLWSILDKPFFCWAPSQKWPKLGENRSKMTKNG